MKNIKRIIAIALVLLMMLPTAIACGNKENTDTAQSSAPVTDAPAVNGDNNSEPSGDNGNKAPDNNNNKPEDQPTKEPDPTEPTKSLKVIETVSIIGGEDNEEDTTVQAEESEGSNTDTPTTTERVNPTFRTVGRTYIRESGLACDFAGTGIRFTADCEKSVFVKVSSDKNLYFTVYIDGVRLDSRVSVRKDTADTWICIAKGLSKGVHEIELVKQSQFTQATCKILEVGVIGEFGNAPEERDYFIEVYGDSIANGSNILGGGTSMSSTDATKAFAWLAAKALNTDCSLIGCGGLGLVASDVDFVMSDIWDLCGSNELEGTPKHDFSRIPDIVVIELGVNDVAHGSPENTPAYQAAVKALIESIREKYGNDVPIVWLYGYHAEDNFDNTKPIIEALGGIDANIYTCAMPESSVSPNNGGDGYHPNEETTVSLTERLIEALAPLLEDRSGIYGSDENDDYANDVFDLIKK